MSKADRKKPKPHIEEEEAALVHDESNWLVSYADMMTLLFGFFVLMYAFSRVDREKFEVVRKDLVKYFGGEVKVEPSLLRIKEEIEEMTAVAGIDEDVKVIIKNSEVVLRLNGKLLFRSGSAELMPASEFFLSEVTKMVKKHMKPSMVQVEGHTDPVPIRSPIFPTNWELSAARASRVVREFGASGISENKLVAKGYGSSRPIVPNYADNGKVIPENLESNRRVEIRIAFDRDLKEAIDAVNKSKLVTVDRNVDDRKLAPERDVAATDPAAAGQRLRQLQEERIESAEARLEAARRRLEDSQRKIEEANRLKEMERRAREMERKAIEAERRMDRMLRQLER